MSTLFETSRLLSGMHLIHGFGTKQIGDSVDEKKLQAHIFTETGVKYPLIRLNQAHTDSVLTITSLHDPSLVNQADGVVTALRGVMLTVRTADCVPIIFFDPVAMIIGISHQGWRGTRAKLPYKMVQSMIALGSSPQDIRCAIGPCIHSCCYELYGARKESFLDCFGASVVKKLERPMSPRLDQNYTHVADVSSLDLPVAVCETLFSAGIITDHIDVHPDCTCHLPEKYFSYHRTKTHEGQMSHFVGLRI